MEENSINQKNKLYLSRIISSYKKTHSEKILFYEKGNHPFIIRKPQTD